MQALLVNSHTFHKGWGKLTELSIFVFRIDVSLLFNQPRQRILNGLYIYQNSIR